MVQKNKNLKRAKKYKFKMRHLAAFLLAVFLVGTFFFGGKVRNMAYGKLMARGNHFFNGGEYNLDKAAKYYKVAGFVDRKASYPHYQLARVLFVKGEHQDALSEIDKALSLNPENKRAFYVRGLIDGYAGNFKAAVDDFQKFIAFAPKEWAGHNDLAWAYFQDGDFQNAADAARKGLEVKPGNPWLLNGLGVSLEALGKNDEAKAVLDEAAQIAQNLTPKDWKKAYPGNDAESAPWDLARFKGDVNFNLQLAADPFASAGKKGKFQAACGSTVQGMCNGTSCVQTTCDPDHLGDPTRVGMNENGIPYCSATPCASDCDCGGGTYLPVEIPACAPGCSYNGYSGLLVWQCVMGGGNPLAGCVGWGVFVGKWGGSPPSCGAGQCCFVQVKDCNAYDAKYTAVPTVCSVNNNPTVQAIRPEGNELDPGSLIFEWSFSDPDAGDSQSRYVLDVNCDKTGSRHIDENSSSTSRTLGGFGNKDICTWTITVYDSGAPVKSASDTASFGIKDAPPLTACACGTPERICRNAWPSDGVLCSSGSVGNKVSGGLYGEWTWTCNPGSGCNLQTSCSAQGGGYCGWIETNP